MWYPGAYLGGTVVRLYDPPPFDLTMISRFFLIFAVIIQSCDRSDGGSPPILKILDIPLMASIPHIIASRVHQSLECRQKLPD
jgi:hypothetical protein